MTASKYKVELTDAERNQLTGVVRGGRSPARKIKRAALSDQGLSDLAEGLAISPAWRECANAL